VYGSDIGGHFEGKITGDVLPGGADMQWLKPDGIVAILTHRYMIKTTDSAIIYIHNPGLRVTVPGILDRILMATLWTQGVITSALTLRLKQAPKSMPVKQCCLRLFGSTFCERRNTGFLYCIVTSCSDILIYKDDMAKKQSSYAIFFASVAMLKSPFSLSFFS